MEQYELMYFFIRTLSTVKYFYRKMIPGIIMDAKRYKFSKEYSDEDYEISLNRALEIVFKKK